MNWRGRPLTSHDVIVQSIAATTTRTGPTVHAQLDTDTYPTGIQVTDQEIADLPIHRHRFHSDWNYTVHPRPARHTPAADDTADQPLPVTNPRSRHYAVPLEKSSLQLNTGARGCRW